ncbi:MAG: hypothetical protein HYZ14_06430 [Bacteroidetes bacterium]|nr:hypothetical protein [Bacteroidota bacterium]
MAHQPLPDRVVTASAIHDNQSTNQLLIVFARIFERTAYYGFTGCIAIYLLNPPFNWDSLKALGIFSILATGIMITNLVGGLLGDLVTGRKTAALIGAICQTSGIILLCFPFDESIYIAVGLIILGTGFFSPNILAFFAQCYQTSPAKMDAGFMWLSIAANVGAFLGSFFIVWLGLENLTIAFLIAAAANLGAILCISFLKKIPLNTSGNNAAETPSKFILVYAVLAISTIFWMFYELSFYEFQIKASLIKDQFNSSIFHDDNSIAHTLNSFLVVGSGIILAIIWTFVNSNSFVKLSLGLLITSTCFILLALIPGNNASSYFTFFIAISTFLALGETSISVSVQGIIGRYAPAKFLATLFGSVSLVHVILNYAIGMIIPAVFYETDSGYLTLIGSAVITLILSLVIFILYRKFIKGIPGPVN